MRAVSYGKEINLQPPKPKPKLDATVDRTLKLIKEAGSDAA